MQRLGVAATGRRTRFRPDDARECDRAAEHLHVGHIEQEWPTACISSKVRRQHVTEAVDVLVRLGAEEDGSARAGGSCAGADVGAADRSGNRATLDGSATLGAQPIKAAANTSHALRAIAPAPSEE
jgi:hypothetical protein